MRHLVGLGIAVALASGCGDFGQRFRDNWETCAPEVLRENIGTFLGAADWRTALQSQVLMYGIDAVTCAVKAFWHAATTKSTTRTAALIQLPRDTLRIDRAELWLRSRGRIK